VLQQTAAAMPVPREITAQRVTAAAERGRSAKMSGIMRILVIAITLVVILGSIAGTLWILGQAVPPGENPSGAWLFDLWAVSPYLGLLAVGTVAHRATVSVVVWLVMALFAAMVGLFFLYMGLLVDKENAQAGLLVLVVPVMQWPACLVAAAVAIALWFTARRKETER
jgi:hypothetical protein